ncbi:hypothetical protein [Glaciimonas immobilis]|uniref:Uncharacterized protein n=1 Tax=Glaciimonas immobilis TaxID=728004 RepID=A0A840RZ31_9BURK|nr:hypothetical protein [Glaciimonas immobilis]KAF3998401.1 hypothetical protein HAV38_08080 [Glaciimonas immobilis]MBB5202116.1 hypothetical protein [Glaciimonas immobilis]
MKKFVLLLITAMTMLAASSASYAWGRGGYYGHGGFYGPSVGISIGDPYYYGPPPVYYAPPPVYYAPQPVYIEPEQQTYIERNDTVAAGPDIKYYCSNPVGYYPQIARCPKGWLKVVPDNSPPR